jgi:hypothetical protein
MDVENIAMLLADKKLIDSEKKWQRYAPGRNGILGNIIQKAPDFPGLFISHVRSAKARG